MKKIYVVSGTTGEYSDRSEWLVAAFTKKVDAETRVVEATARAREIQQESRDYNPYRYNDAGEETDYVSFDSQGRNEFDPNMKLDYTGTIYYVSEVDLITEKRRVN